MFLLSRVHTICFRIHHVVHDAPVTGDVRFSLEYICATMYTYKNLNESKRFLNTGFNC